MKHTQLIAILFLMFFSIGDAIGQNASLSANDYYLLARKNIEERNYAAAIDNYTIAINKVPLGVFYFDRAMAYATIHQRDNEIADLKMAIYKNAGDDQAYLYLGNAYCVQEKYDLAIENITKSIRIGADFKKYICRATAYSRYGQYGLAEEDYKKALSYKEEQPNVYYEIGYCQYFQKKYDMAIQNLTISMNMEPTNPYVYLYRGLCLAKKEEYIKAINDFDSVIKIDPSITDALKYKEMCINDVTYGKDK